MSLWDRFVFLLLLSFLLPYIMEIQATDFAQFTAKTQAIFAQPIAALSLVTELPTRQGMALLGRSNTCGTDVLSCLPRVRALRHPTPASCLISELALVRIAAAFLPQPQAFALFENNC